MNKRDSQIEQSRPQIPDTWITENMSSEEKFQNETLRPVIIFQRDLLIETFRNYIHKNKNIFYTYTPEEKLDYIQNCLQKDMKFRNNLKGMIIGQFTLKEYDRYIKNSSALNKRLMLLIKEKLQENVQLFELQSLEP